MTYMSETPMGSEPLTYKAAGVDLDAGDACSRLMFEASRQTWSEPPDGLRHVRIESSDFGALRHVALPLSGSGLVMGLNSDGVGTKIELAERLNDHRTIAFDLFAMVCDDAAINGAEPLLVASVLDFSRLSTDVVAQLAHGLVNAAKVARVCVINGETAELGARVSGFG